MFATLIAGEADGKAPVWFNQNTSGEYFRFSADQGGTLYYITSNKVTNTEWEIQDGEEFVADGNWRRIGGQSYTYTKDTPRDEIIEGHEYNVAYVMWTSKSEIFADDAISRELTESESIKNLSTHVYARSFEKDELVKIYHPGTIAEKRVLLIKWDLEN